MVSPRFPSSMKGRSVKPGGSAKRPVLSLNVCSSICEPGRGGQSGLWLLLAALKTNSGGLLKFSKVGGSGLCLPSRMLLRPARKTEPQGN